MNRTTAKREVLWSTGVFVVGLVWGISLRTIVPITNFQAFPAGVGFFLFLTQDLAWLGFGAVAIPVGWALAPRRAPWHPLSTSLTPEQSVRITIAVFALTAALGVTLVYHGFALSLDEFLARFQAETILHGTVFPRIPEQWVPFAHALQPVFMRYDLDAALWGPGYLPGNGAILAVFRLVGALPWAHVITGSLALVVLARLCARTWPDEKWATFLGVFLLATSPQVWIAAMTSYAMTPHLLLSLAWVALYVRDDLWGHLGAFAVAPLAIGLHQINIHPLVVLPFLLWLPWDRRWRLAAGYAAWYAAWIAFWFFWQGFFLHADPGPAAGVEGAFMLDKIEGLMGGHSMADLILWPLNLFRFVAWQNLAFVPLVLTGMLRLRRAPRLVRTGSWSVLLLLSSYVVLMPSQGHGWGYRYLHPVLGFLVLLGTYGAVTLVREAPADQRPGVARAIAVLGTLSLIALPLRGYQVERFVRPFAAAAAHIEGSGESVVIVDDRQIWFGVDLVRNDPSLRRAPYVMAMQALSNAQWRWLCDRFDPLVVGPQQLPALAVSPARKSSLRGGDGDAATKQCER